MSKNDAIIAALDIGTTFTRSIIARYRKERGIEILGAAVFPSQGVRKSVINNSKEAIDIIRATVESAEREALIDVDELHVGISGGHIQCCNSGAVVNILDGDDTIKESHINDLVKNAETNAAERGRSIIHKIPQEYYLDGHLAEQKPVGLAASRVEAKYHMITADRTILENHGRLINDAGFKISNIYWNLIADGNCAISDEEKKSGVLLVDIGGGSTSYAVYFNNTIFYSNVFGVGGDHITNDLLMGLNLSASEAEELKLSYPKRERENSNVIKMGSQSAKNKRPPLFQDVEMIIDSRVEELVQFVKDDVEQRNLMPYIENGVVFVGGTTNLYHFREKVEKIFTCNVRVAIPSISTHAISNEPTTVFSEGHAYLNDPSCATVIGIIISACKLQMSRDQNKPGLIKRIFS